MLKPLENFYCDTCGELIEEPSHGYVEWGWDEGDDQRLDTGWRIVHHPTHSPRPNGCYNNLPLSTALDEYVGPDGHARLLAFLDVGEHITTVERRNRVKNMPEFVEFARRLTVPHYEEARRYWSAAEADGYFDGANEVWPYTQAALKELIERYSDS